MKIKCVSIDGNYDAIVYFTFYGPKDGNGVIPTITKGVKMDVFTAKSLGDKPEADIKTILNDAFDLDRVIDYAPDLNPDGTEVTPDPDYTEDPEYAKLTS